LLSCGSIHPGQYRVIDRIAILGGSSVYVPEFIFSIITHNINVREIVLFGRPGQKLPIVAEFCRRLMQRSGHPALIHETTDLAQAVTGAKYVLNHVRIGGMAARLRDESMPPLDGMVGDESLGPGGLTNALRTLPTVFAQAAVVQATNPGCIYINLTNPMGILVEALNAHTSLSVIGVCDLPTTYIRKIAAILRLPPGDLDVDYVGLNHLGWFQDVKVRRRSVMSALLDRLEHETDGGWDRDLIRLFRMIPTRGPNLYFHSDRVVAEQRRAGKHRAQALHEAEQQILELYRDEHLSEIPLLTRTRNTPWYEETILPLIQALEGRKKTRLVLCVRNDGAIRDLPPASSVEVPVDVCEGAFKPRRVGNCPHFLHGLFAAVKESERLIVEASFHKSYDYALQAFTINPFVHSLDTAKQFLDRVIRDEHLELH
jgi:6-phospho-beta-glucosidase